ncbi:Methyl-CpG-binding domain-containing protein 10 [Striga hermonthica]|uniref:Methyl-CpG-binding domain-containing protein 10 n=1 Tax=Striga hermonthica TaxID=68872 RepID=A0A9N7MQW0_STRHE|nr:Methyl-CpG-binding domain-containing protein 10 [Striga hermonthica]
MATGEENKQDDVVSIELPAPTGWVKKFTPKKGGTPQRNDIVFISPTGEEIKNKRQLDKYLKSHPDGPAVNEFDWGTGDTPRRSARLSEKSKAPEGPTSSSPKKRRKKLSTKKEFSEKSNADAEGETQDVKEDADVDPNGVGDGEVITKEAIPEKPDTEKIETGTETETKVVLDQSSAAEMQTEANTENSNDDVQKSNEVVPEVPFASDAQNDSTTKKMNMDVEKSNNAKNEESNSASPEKEAPYGKVDSVEPIDEDKDAEKQKPENPVENDVGLHEQENSNDDVQNSNEVAPEVIFTSDAQNDSSTQKLNMDVKKSENAKNEESISALPEKEASYGKVDSVEPVDEDKDAEKQNSEKPVENDVGLHEQEPTVGS